MNEIIEINGKRYRKLDSLWNGGGVGYSKTIDKNGNITITPFLKDIDICHSDKWIMIDGIEYEELGVVGIA